MAVSRICSIPDCGKPRYKRDWCNAHYIRWRRHGDPLQGRTPPGEPLRFFLEVVLAYAGKECLIWPYARITSGYAELRIDGETRHVHREVCEHFNGPPPNPDHDAAHSCGKGHEGCVAGGHLVWKTRAANMADKLIHGTHNRGERHYLAKLTAADALQIRSLAATVSAVDLGERFGVERQTINDITAGRTWRWLG